ncbi:hypothetical protein [Ralstonia mannitolilytica]|uniref:hypothetical protein n=1 Tax=Ralstonia mannitolilytica TaxID=105219 RepID=UPI0028F5E36A|nr:hypothetical protein [Ralstonia mannitolilytica]CAJ0884120.1 hypothetical protein R76727_03623 [Ralstonia mannitolilytica]
MPTIFIRDELRASVEAATGGLCTVHYTQSGQPSYFRWIPKFTLDAIDASLGSGVHPAFIVDGIERDGIWIGMYPGVVKNGELLSLPGVDPAVGQPYTYFVNAARACGAGFHVMTNAEWAAVALLTAKSGPQPRGNTNWGRAHDATWEAARRVDAGTPGTTTGTGRTLTGAGPVTWRHDGTPAGIADLVGNVWEFTPGLRLVDGEIQVLANNDAAIASDFSGAAPWKAILQDGSLVAPGTSGTLKLDANAAYSDNGAVNDIGGFKVATSIANYTGPSGDEGYSYDFASAGLTSLTAATGVTTPAVLKALVVAPLASLGLNGRFYMRNRGLRYPFRGGAWNSGASAGLGALYLNDPASGAYWSLGARPAKV